MKSTKCQVIGIEEGIREGRGEGWSVKSENMAPDLLLPYSYSHPNRRQGVHFLENTRQTWGQE